MLGFTKTASAAMAALTRLLDRRGEALHVETIGGVPCYVAGTLVRPVSAPSADYMARAEALRLVLVVDVVYHREHCGHWSDLPYGTPG